MGINKVHVHLKDLGKTLTFGVLITIVYIMEHRTAIIFLFYEENFMLIGFKVNNAKHHCLR